MIVEIKYKDKTNWESVKGTVTNWENYSKKLKDSVIKPHYVAPEIVTDIWGGVERDIQHTKWDSNSFEMFLKGSEIESLVNMKSSSIIYINAYDENSSGVTINKSYELDLTKSDLFMVNEPEQVDTTDSWKVNIIFRTERTVINKTTPVELTNNIKIESNTSSDEWRLFNKSAELSGTNRSICNLNSTRVAIYESTGQELQAYDFNGINYEKVGNPFPFSGDASSMGLFNLNSTSIIIWDRYNYVFAKYSFDGTDWARIGNYKTIYISSSVSITRLTDDSITFTSLAIGTIQAYSFDGTDWNTLGNSYTLPTGGTSVVTTSLSSTSIVYLVVGLSIMQTLSFDGTDWTDSGNSYAASGNIYNLSETTIVYKNENIITILSFDGTDWTDLNIAKDLEDAGYLTTTNKTDIVYITDTSIASYTIGDIYYYFSDYDILDYKEEVEPVEIEWFDSSKKRFQKVTKEGYQIVQYLSYSDSVKFQKLLDSSETTSINGIEVTELLIEPTPLAQDLVKLVVSGIYNVIENNFNVSPNSAYTLEIINNAISYYFYTDYPPELISEAPVISTYDNSGGVNIPVKRITKQVYQAKFYYGASRIFDLKKRFELFGDVTLEIDEIGTTVTVLEAREVSPTKLGNDRYEAIVNCLVETTLDY